MEGVGRTVHGDGVSLLGEVLAVTCYYHTDQDQQEGSRGERLGLETDAYQARFARQ